MITRCAKCAGPVARKMADECRVFVSPGKCRLCNLDRPLQTHSEEAWSTREIAVFVRINAINQWWNRKDDCNSTNNTQATSMMLPFTLAMDAYYAKEKSDTDKPAK